MKFMRENKVQFIALLLMGLCLGGCTKPNRDVVESNNRELLQIQEEKNDVDASMADDENSIMVLVNKERNLPDGYRPEDLVVPNVIFSFNEVVEKSYLRREAAEALEKLFLLAEEEGITLYAISGFRSYERQIDIYDDIVRTLGQEEADKVSAQPGFSEHQTGLAMDVSSVSNNFELNEQFADTAEGIWLAENAHRAGFIIRYPQGKEDITGYAYEPWHIRYVGDIAGMIYEQNITLEEYFNNK